MGDQLTRRNLLRGIGIGTIGTSLSGLATASENKRYAVGMNPSKGLGPVRRKAKSVNNEFDFGSLGKALSGKFPEEAIQGLQNNPNVTYIEEVGTAEALSQQTPSSYVQVEADTTLKSDITGTGVSVAVVDTGIESDHETLQRNIGAGFAATSTTCSEDCLGSNSNDCLESWDDDDNHGTKVAGTIAAADNGLGILGIAPESTLHPVKALDCTGNGSYDDVAAGIEWATDQGHEVINLSLGGTQPSELLQNAVQYARQNGSVVVAAAGNDGCCDSVRYPAAYPEVIAVSSVDQNDKISVASSQGPEVDIAAPGVDILSTTTSSAYGNFSGTSFACPHVSACAALLIANGKSPDDVRSTLLSSADDIGLSTSEQGAGRLNAANALGITSDQDPDPIQLSVTSLDATNITTDTATITGELTDISNTTEAQLSFEYGLSETDLNLTIDAGTLQTAGTFTADLVGLNSDTTYFYRAVAKADGTRATSTIQTVTTQQKTNESPTAQVSIEDLNVSTRTTGPWQRVTVDWSITDNGQEVTTTSNLIAGSSVVDSTVTQGSTTGSHDLKTRKNVDSVEFTVEVGDESVSQILQI